MKLRAYITALYATLLTSLFAVSPVQSGSITLLGAGNAPSAAPSKTLTNVGGVGTADGNANLTFASANIGTATATRVILIAATRQNSAFTGCAVNSQGATKIVASGTGETDFWSLVGSAAGSGAQTIVCSGGPFENRSMEVWVMDGLSSTTLQHSADSNNALTQNISVTAGDFLFVNQWLNGNSAQTFSGSTEVPAHNYSPNNTGLAGSYADWTVVATNASFAITSGINPQMSSVSFR